MGVEQQVDWDLDFGDDNVVPISAASHRPTRRGPDTRRGLPRSLPPEPVGPPAPERPLQRTPPGQVRRMFPPNDPQAEATLEFEAAALPRRAEGRRLNHADLDLQRARHDDPYHQSALIQLSQLNNDRSQAWIAFVVFVGAAGALVAWFIV